MGWTFIAVSTYKSPVSNSKIIQESRAIAKKPRDAAAVVFGLKFDEPSFESQASELQTDRRKTEFNAKWLGLSR